MFINIIHGQHFGILQFLLAKDISIFLLSVGIAIYGQYVVNNAFRETPKYVNNRLNVQPEVKKKEEEKRQTPPPDNKRRVGFPLPKNDDKNNNKSSSDSSADDSTSDEYDNKDVNSQIVKIKKRRLKNQIDRINDLKDINVGQPDPYDPVPHWTPVQLPTPRATVGQGIYQPISDYEYEVFSAPLIDDLNKALNPLEINTELIRTTTAEKVVRFLAVSAVDKAKGDYEKNLKIEELATVFGSPIFNPNAEVGAIFGLQGLYKVGDAFSLYSNAFLTDPLFNIPTRIKITTIKGITSNTIRFNQTINQKLIPKDPAVESRISNAINFDDEQEAEIDVESLLNFYGAINLYQGGSQEQQKLDTDYKTNPQAVYQSPYLKDLPSINDNLNGNTNPNSPKLKTTPEPLKAKNKLDLVQMMLGVMTVKLGLDQFPTQLPSLQEPNFTLDSEGKRRYGQPNPPIETTSLAGGLAWSLAGIQKNVGRFPLEIETDSDQKTPDPNNPNVLVPKKNHEYIPDLATGLSSALTIGLAGTAIANNNFNLNLRNSRSIEDAKNAAVKSMECSCSMFDFSGARKNPAKRCLKNNFNFNDAKGIDDFMAPRNEQCYVGTQEVDNTTLKAMLNDILFGVNIIKGAFFKGQDELNDQVSIVEEIGNTPKQRDDDFDQFVKDFNDGDDPLNQNYPTKAKLNVENKNQSNT